MSNKINTIADLIVKTIEDERIDTLRIAELEAAIEHLKEKPESNRLAIGILDNELAAAKQPEPITKGIMQQKVYALVCEVEDELRARGHLRTRKTGTDGKPEEEPATAGNADGL